MKRKMFWMPVALITYFLGLLLVPDLGSGLSDCVVHLEAKRKVNVDNVGCEPSKIFPGRSASLADLPKGNSGYFPSESYAYGWEGRETFMNDWYGKHLKVMREPSLIKESRRDVEVYRFLWLRTFHHPMAVRVGRNSSTINLFVKELSGAGGYDPGNVIVSKKIALDQKQWCRFIAKLERANYWSEPLEQEDNGYDGAQWILEGVRDGRYHAVDRWSPDHGAFREACIYLLELAGIETAKLGDELY